MERRQVTIGGRTRDRRKKVLGAPMPARQVYRIVARSREAKMGKRHLKCGRNEVDGDRKMEEKDLSAFPTLLLTRGSSLI